MFLEVCVFYEKYFVEIQKFILSDNFNINCKRIKGIRNLIIENNFKTIFEEIVFEYSNFIKLIKESKHREFSIGKTIDLFNQIKWGKIQLM